MSQLTLDQHLHHHRPADLPAVLALLQPILEAVAALHAAGQAHGAIGPAALRFTPAGVLDVPHFTAHTCPPQPRSEDYAFRAPESFDDAPPNAREDTYALGALLYKVLTATLPPPAKVRAQNPAPLRPELFPQWPAELLEITNRCLALDAAERYATVQALEEALHYVPVAAALPAAPPSPVPMPPAKLRLPEHLPNASVGKPYQQNLPALLGVPRERFTRLQLQVPEGSGLQWDDAAAILHGTPLTPGEFQLTATYTLPTAEPHRPALTHPFALLINPDPTSLWQDRRSDPQALFAKPDTATDHLVTPALTILAASRQGRSHAHEGKPRDDDFALHFVPETGWHILLVADGAGSAQYSRRGSQLACATAAAQFIERLAPGNPLDAALATVADDEAALETLRRQAANLFIHAAYTSLQAIDRERAAHHATLRDFSTTFIAVLAKRVGDRWFLTSFSIGDGGAGVVLSAESVQPLTRADSGEFAGQTLFLTMPHLFQDATALLGRVHACWCAGFQYLAVMTDGITDPLFPSESSLGEPAAWAELQARLTTAGLLPSLPATATGEATLLEWLKFPSPGNHDDRTLLLAVPQP